MDVIERNNRTKETARRRSVVEEEKRIKYDKILQIKENREEKAAEKRKQEIQRAKEKAEVKNQRVQAVIAEKKKAEKNDCSDGYRCCRSSFVNNTQLASNFHHSLPCSVHQGNYGNNADSRRYSMDTLSAQLLKKAQKSSSPTHSSPQKTKSVANLQKLFEINLHIQKKSFQHQKTCKKYSKCCN
uniref:Uncharacterized protein n=1 Tax=Panagrolaimus superbus TaxID=310955 RepID=A0A914Y184_9BILA